jgi:hypothetical protein
LVINPNEYFNYVGRTVIRKDDCNIVVIFKGGVLDNTFRKRKPPMAGNILEMKLKYTGHLTQYPDDDRDLDLIIRYDRYTYFKYNVLTENVRYLFELFDECKLYFNSKLCCIQNENSITLIFDMREGQNVLYLKINETPLLHAISNISRIKRRIEIWINCGKSITLISSTHLKCLPIDLSEKYIYHDAITGEIIKND